jgi:hypothetical protein
MAVSFFLMWLFPAEKYFFFFLLRFSCEEEEKEKEKESRSSIYTVGRCLFQPAQATRGLTGVPTTKNKTHCSHRNCKLHG